VKELHQPLIHVHEILLSEEQFALLLDEHGVAFVGSDLDFVGFMQRFREEPDTFLDRPVIHLDDRAAEQLVELEFEPVFLRLAYLKCESHTGALCIDRANDSQLRETAAAGLSSARSTTESPGAASRLTPHGNGRIPITFPFATQWATPPVMVSENETISAAAAERSPAFQTRRLAKQRRN
jgi:hypothetical protein